MAHHDTSDGAPEHKGHEIKATNQHQTNLATFLLGHLVAFLNRLLMTYLGRFTSALGLRDLCEKIINLSDFIMLYSH